MTNKDSTRDPKLTHHYVSHALLVARLEFEKPDSTKPQVAKKNLMNKLSRLDKDDSPYSKLSKDLLKYLRKAGEWETLVEVENFNHKYEMLKLEIIGY